MKEQFIVHFGDTEILAVIIRNGLFNGSWPRMHQVLLKGDLIFPGINLSTLTHLNSFEKKHRININHIIFNSLYPVQLRQIQRICYTICRGIFSYPCVACDNRIEAIPYSTILYQTFLARPVIFNDTKDNPPLYEGVNRMFPDPNQFPNPESPEHDHLLQQLNKIRECFPCQEQNGCLDHQYVGDATLAVIKEYQLENSFLGKILARSLCWMTAEESRLMRIIEKEGLLSDPHPYFPPPLDEPENNDYYSPGEGDNFYSENSDSSHYPAEPNPLLDVLNDLRESIRDTIRLLVQLKDREIKSN